MWSLLVVGWLVCCLPFAIIVGKMVKEGGW